MRTRRGFLVAGGAAVVGLLAGGLPGPLAGEGAPGGSQSPPGLAAADRLAAEAPPEAGRSVVSLARYIKGNTTSELERARALYRWLTLNVAYDYEAFRTGNLTQDDVDPDTVMRRRITVCSGYARVFETVGALLGLKVVYVTGRISADPEFRFGGSPNYRHAWNAVRVEGKWRLVDATWGAGSVNLSSGGFQRAVDDRYFLTDPLVLIRSHYPDDPQWQLIRPPVGIREYLEWAEKGERFFRRG